ncbi:MAG: hypothetical protein ACREOL_07700 [Candidatus Dormibacteria bacterium]
MNEPRRRRRSAPEPAPAEAATAPAPSSWGQLLGWVLVAVAAVSLVVQILALVALGSAIAHLGAPQGPLEFALAFIGAVVGLGADLLIIHGAMTLARPQSSLGGPTQRVFWGLGLELVAAAMVGLLASSWGFAAIYVVLLCLLAYLWQRVRPPALARPAARHPGPEALEPGPAPAPERFSLPWVGSAPPPPSSERRGGQDRPARGAPTGPTGGRGSRP